MKYLFIFALFILTLFFNLPANRADSSQSYQDYLYQYSQYRQALSEFKVAKNEYEKFKSLSSQTAALIKTNNILQVRAVLLSTYLSFLGEKLKENSGLSGTDRNMYLSYVNNELAFLQTHKDLIPAIASIDDAVRVSEQLSSHYLVLERSMRQTVVGLSLGNLADLAGKYDQTYQQLVNFIGENRFYLAAEKQAVIDRWLLSIQNKKTLYQQKVDIINTTNMDISANSSESLAKKMDELIIQTNEAKAYLTEGTANMKEVMRTIKLLN